MNELEKYNDRFSNKEDLEFLHIIYNVAQELYFGIKRKNGKDDYLSPWTFTSSDKRFEMNFKPIIDRHSNTNALLISSNQHQVFGEFTGTIVLDDGSKIKLNKFLGFAEKVINKW